MDYLLKCDSGHACDNIESILWDFSPVQARKDKMPMALDYGIAKRRIQCYQVLEMFRKARIAADRDIGKTFKLSE